VEEGAKADNPYRFETSIGHLESAAIKMYDDLNIDGKVVIHGAWCGRTIKLHYQDIFQIVRR
jgi:hypothetical protein